MNSPVSGFALRFAAVSKTFAESGPALRDIDLALPAGGITALVGPDGAGKTTLLRLAAGLLLPDKGRIESFGLDSVTAGGQLHSLIGYMPQRFGLYEDLSVQENLQLYADLYGIPQHERHNRFADLMRMTNLAKFGDRLAGRLSGGMKQKLGLACTLLNRPRLLLLDEPSVGVDPVSRRELWQIIATLVAEFGTTVLLSTAYMDEAERCQRVVLLDRGEILHQDAPAAFHALARDCSFLLSSPRTSNRALQQRLTAHPDVVDSVVQSGAVRTVVRPGRRPDWSKLFPGAETVASRAVAPRLEDAFILLLTRRRSNAPDAETVCFNPHGAGAKLDGMRDPVIEVDQVDRWFGRFQAVKKLSFQVGRGEIFG
ncbi:ABC transporter ATP-binding protein, partial [Methylomonas koyamae]